MNFELSNIHINKSEYYSSYVTIECDLLLDGNKLLSLRRTPDDDYYYFTEYFASHSNDIHNSAKEYFLKYPKYFEYLPVVEDYLKEITDDLLRINDMKNAYLKNGCKYLVCVNFKKRTEKYKYSLNKDFMLSLNKIDENIIKTISKDFKPVEIKVFDSLESITL